jgi:hypothetical protein
MSASGVSTTTRLILALSNGNRCYKPGCPEPVLRYEDGRWHRNLEAAHIKARSAGGPRHHEGPKLTLAERNDLPNLINLCRFHHSLVDSDETTYTFEVLHEWKREAEAGGVSAVVPDELLRMTAAELDAKQIESLLDKTAARVESGIEQVLERLDGRDAEAAELMRALLTALQTPSDTVTMLRDSAARLSGLEDSAGLLANAASSLGNVEDQAGMLKSAAAQITKAAAQIQDSVGLL